MTMTPDKVEDVKDDDVAAAHAAQQPFDIPVHTGGSGHPRPVMRVTRQQR